MQLLVLDVRSWRAGDVETDETVARRKLQAGQAGEKAADSAAGQQAIRAARASGVVSEDGAALRSVISDACALSHMRRSIGSKAVMVRCDSKTPVEVGLQRRLVCVLLDTVPLWFTLQSNPSAGPHNLSGRCCMHHMFSRRRSRCCRLLSVLLVLLILPSHADAADAERSVCNADIAAVDWEQVTHETIDKTAKVELGAYHTSA